MTSAVASGSAMLSALILCGILGLLGQGIRAAIGLKNANAFASTTPSQQSQFSAAYFGLSMTIGFISGVFAGVAVGLDNFIHNIDPYNVKVLLGVIAAGYAGADFIENAMSIVIPSGAAPPPATAPSSTFMVINIYGSGGACCDASVC